jgi:hypothetical protein
VNDQTLRKSLFAANADPNQPETLSTDDREELTSLGFPWAAVFGCRSTLLFQLPPIQSCMRFSRTRLTDTLHRRCSVTRARQA